jgi:helicase
MYKYFIQNHSKLRVKLETLTEYGFEEDLAETFLKEGITKLNPVQEKAVKNGLFDDGKSFVIASPTASGKTLIAELLSLHVIQKKKLKVLYSCPLRALASEHYENFKKRYSKFGVKVGLSMGDFDSRDPWLANYDLIVATSEKIDSLIRHKAPWLMNVGLLIVDEIHSLDSDRGPTVEVLITRMKFLKPGIQVLGLSATIPNASELADWLDAKLVESEWRPIPLFKGIYYDGAIEFEERDDEPIESKYKTPMRALIDHSLNSKGQVLVFANSRRSAESNALALGAQVSDLLSEKEKVRLRTLSQDILDVLESPTSQCRKLAEAVEKGSAFHHAGLLNGQRKLIEDAFRDNYIKVICATPTLAMGVNLPATIVMFQSMYRYTGRGSVLIPTKEYLQMIGRAGRPKYDKFGEGLVIARDELEKEEFLERYVRGEPEDVESRLSMEPVLRTHTLASIAVGFTRTWKDLENFFSKTFYAHQYKDLKSLMETVDRIERDLEEHRFVRNEGGKYVPTKLGIRVAQLYIDPLSANKILTGLGRVKEDEIPYLYLIADTEEMKPYLTVGQNEEADLYSLSASSATGLPVNIYSYEFDDFQFLNKFKTCLLFSEWMNEISEEDILQKYKVAPGILRAKLRNAEWMIYAASELARLSNMETKYLNDLSKRLKYGVRRELLPLVNLKGIGRIRGRRLYSAGFKSASALKKASVDELGKILGPGIALRVKRQLGQKGLKLEKKIARAEQTKIS